jgi:3-oxoacyl-(acyl-carrier-protein) synthase
LPPEGLVRPFDANRKGLVMSEGAGAIVLERLSHAIEAGRRPLAVILGGAATTDSYHLVTPEPEAGGAIAAIRSALESADLVPETVAERMYVNAHGTGTQMNDAAETRALKAVFGDSAKRLQISSTKSMTGHMIGAAGAIETIVCVLAINRGVLPPTINLHDPDPECNLDYIPNVARESRVDYALNNTFGFGGHNVSLLFGRA